MTLLLDRYELGAELGAGGMGRVVTAYDRRLERPVAVKLIREELLEEPGTRERLLREARSAARLHHPNTVAVFDVGEADGRPFVVMELIEGRSLDDRLRTEGKLEPTNAAAVVAAVLDGLAAAHARGLVHRDVKPSNVLLPDDGGVKLADFGIAADLGSSTSLTGSGQVVGSPRYLAPERVDGEAATAASDVYAAGIVLYELLAGRVPFAADNPVATAVAHQQQPVPPLTELAPHIPAGLAAVAERALAKDPAQRFTSAASMRSALLEACDDEGLFHRDGPSSTPRTGPIDAPAPLETGGLAPSTGETAAGPGDPTTDGAPSASTGTEGASSAGSGSADADPAGGDADADTTDDDDAGTDTTGRDADADTTDDDDAGTDTTGRDAGADTTDGDDAGAGADTTDDDDAGADTTHRDDVGATPGSTQGEPIHLVDEVPAAGDPLAADQPLTSPTPGERVGETTMALSEDGAEHATTVPEGTPPPTGRRRLPRWFAPVTVAVLLIAAAVLALGSDDEVEPSGLGDLAEEVEASGIGLEADRVADDPDDPIDPDGTGPV